MSHTEKGIWHEKRVSVSQNWLSLGPWEEQWSSKKKVYVPTYVFYIFIHAAKFKNEQKNRHFSLHFHSSLGIWFINKQTDRYLEIMKYAKSKCHFCILIWTHLKYNIRFPCLFVRVVRLLLRSVCKAGREQPSLWLVSCQTI